MSRPDSSMQQLEALSLKQVVIDDSFWSSRQYNVMNTVVPYQWQALNDEIPGAEPSHTIENFRLAAGEAQGEYYGMVFQDSDLGKWLETVGFVLAGHPDPQLEKIADGVIELIGRAQQPDGYINTYYTVKEPGRRWTDLRDKHELYCAGHFMEAAVSYYHATGKTRLLEIMCRYADHIATVFGSEPGQKRGYDGHPEVELALVKLYQATGQRKYLELSRFFVDERGRQPHFFDKEAEESAAAGMPKQGRDRRPYDYYQAHLPVRGQTTAEGHAVRAVYLYSAMADLAALYGDDSLMIACRELWNDVVQHKMYVTGGIGSSAFEERFTVPYDLPNDRAYTETCAAIGLVFWAQRMLLAERDRKYADVMELALYNGVMSGISLDGRSYFYVNPLEVWPAAADFRNDMLAVKTSRQPWFGCACCPPNIARLIASLGQYVYSKSSSGDELYVHLYIGSTIELEVQGYPVKLAQQGQYPWDGQVALEVSMEQPAEFTLFLRVPGWCRQASISVNGEPVDLASLTKGYAGIRRLWERDNRIEISLDMPVERVYSHPNIRENAGKVALQRGPLVYCLEEEDNGSNLQDIVLTEKTAFEAEFHPELLNGVTVLTGRGLRTAAPNQTAAPAYTTETYPNVETTIRAIPYYAWCNRTPGEMIVWLRRQS